MRVLVFILVTMAAMPRAVHAGDAEGCADLKQLTRLEGCAIVECSAKHHDAFDAGDGSGAPTDANINALSYSCPVGDLQKMRRDFDAQLRKAGYQNISEDNNDPASPGLTARRNSQWVRWSGSSEDGSSAYSITAASASSEKFKAEACAVPPLFSPLKQCEVVECTSKSEDSVAMRTGQKEQSSLTGNVQTVTLACPSINPAQTFSMVEGELRKSGFEILFSDREHPESGWMTGRSGKRWVELVSAPDGEAVSYALTVVPSAEVLTASKPEPKAAPAAVPEPVSEPKPVQTTAQIVMPPAPVSTPSSAPAPVSEPVPARSVPAAPAVAAPATAPPTPTFIPPKPILQVPIEATHDRVYSVTGDVVITMLVDVDTDGSVTKARLSGRITKDVLKLEGAAMEAISHWRFEPALQDGRIVSAVNITVQMHFHGRPWRY